MAAQYTHAALWTVIAFAELGDGDKAAELFAMLNPITTRRRRMASSDTVSNRMSSWATSIPRRRTSAAAAGPGTRDRRAGCIARGSSGFSASECTGATGGQSMHPLGMARVHRWHCGIARRTMTSSSRTQSGVCRGVAVLELEVSRSMTALAFHSPTMGGPIEFGRSWGKGTQ